MKFDRLGKHIRKINNRNKDLLVTNLLGINIDKVFITTVANTSGIDLSTYKVLQRNQFATNLMHVGRDERVPIGLYTEEEPALVSPAYFTFEVIDQNLLLPEYLMLIFIQPEFDRYAGYICDSSIRGNLDWERFCEIKVPLPSTEKQRDYIKIYSNLLKLSNNHENSFSDLLLIINNFIENLVEQYGTKKLGAYIAPTDIRNSDNTFGANELRGISTTKKFIISKANTTGVNFASYKIVKPRQFAYVADTSRRGDKIGLAYNANNTFIISSIYTTFEINSDELLPEFLLLWFKRPEFDRYARYNSWGSARETFDWSEMQRVRLPIPPIAVQKSIVAIHHALQSRKKLTHKLKEITKEISPVLIKNAKDMYTEATS